MAEECVTLPDDDDYDLELGIALSLSEATGAAEERPTLPLVRRKLLPPVTVGPRSKKLLRNVHLHDKKQARRIDHIIESAFRTLQVIGGGDPDPRGSISTDALEVALRRLGYPVDGDQLQDMLQCYCVNAEYNSVRDYALYTRETVENRNIVSEWHPKGSVVPATIDKIDINTFRQIFLDCNLRIEKNGLIY
ncbi:formin homology 2 domain containing protein, putative [Babesia ovis]|uniref:Formin homology 2 domain containing protein, putative n=1 Tax=Babesia ovis TaxID=5869 RepID=A0A9W5TDT4_BABOV|nr:formin homology 2 domain containing protein, putative [Babesia ovis]